MSPSLSLAFNQIQRPTWWYEGNKKPETTNPIKPETIAKRAKLFRWLKKQKRKVSGAGTASAGLPGYAGDNKGEQK